MTEYQRITLKESGEDILVDVDEYPFQEVMILYIRFVKYNDITLVPEKFVDVQPQDVLKRERDFSPSTEAVMIAAAEKAREMDVERGRMIREEAKKEMARRVAENAPPPEEGGDHEGLFG